MALPVSANSPTNPRLYNDQMRRILTSILIISVLLGPVSWIQASDDPRVELPAGVSGRQLAVETLWKGIRNLPVGQRPKVILVLGGGGARGLSHIGVLKVFEEEGIPIDQIVGVSVGALIGVLYAGGLDADKIQKMSGEVGWSHLTNYSRTSFAQLFVSDNLLSTAKMETYLKKQIGDVDFSDLRIPFACVATDIRTGERVVLQQGPVAVAARASATIPGLFKPVEVGQRLLVDGGLVDNLPSDIVTKSEQDVIIGILPHADPTKQDISSIFRVLVRSIEIQKDVIINERKKSADFLIEPNVGSMSLIDLAQSERAIKAGTMAARASILDLKQLIIRRTLKPHADLETRRP